MTEKRDGESMWKTNDGEVMGKRFSKMDIFYQVVHEI